MRPRQNGYWKPRVRGVTLVEAVAATALLGTLLVSVLMAQSRLTVQAGRSELRSQAVKIADGLLEAWWPKKEQFPRSASGSVDGQDGWTWQTRSVDNPDANAIGAVVVVLKIFSPGAAQGPPATSVELVLPKHETATTQRTDAH